jgi:hypothetical protein
MLLGCKGGLTWRGVFYLRWFERGRGEWGFNAKGAKSAKAEGTGREHGQDGQYPEPVRGGFEVSRGFWHVRSCSIVGVRIEGDECERATRRLGFCEEFGSVGSDANCQQSALDDFRRDRENLNERCLVVNLH